MDHQISRFKNWIFDLDGTLTVACHDFEAIRNQLGLPENVPILEALMTHPKEKAKKLNQELFEIEMEHARHAIPQPGAELLLAKLVERQNRIGVLTRNSLEIAFTTLKVCGLSDYLSSENILGRESCVPKPDPAGIFQLIKQWGCPAIETVVVGDYLFDLQSGHSAGTHTIHFDTTRAFPWPEITHYRISELNHLTHLLTV